MYSTWAMGIGNQSQPIDRNLELESWNATSGGCVLLLCSIVSPQLKSEAMSRTGPHLIRGPALALGERDLLPTQREGNPAERDLRY